MVGNQMAGEGASHTSWMQDETLVRYNLPAHLAQLFCGVPSQLQRTEQEHKAEVEEYLRTIERLRKRNEDLEGLLQNKEAEMSRLQAALYPSKSGLLLKLGGRVASPEESQALLHDLETSRLRAQTNQATIQNLEKTLKRYQDRIRFLEMREKKPGQDSGYPLRYRDKSLDLTALVEQAALHDQELAGATQVSEATLDILANRSGNLPEGFSGKLAGLKEDRVKLRSEPYTRKTYTPQEAAEKTSIHLTNAAAKEDLLRRQESLKSELLSHWSDWQIASLLSKQREALAIGTANARTSAREHSASEEDQRTLEDIERTGELAGSSDAPPLEKTYALGEQLLRLAGTHQKILGTAGVSGEQGQSDWEKLEAAQQHATDESEVTLEHMLQDSGKPKEVLTNLKNRRTKLRSGAPSKSAHTLSLMSLQDEHEKAKRDVFDQSHQHQSQLQVTEQDAQNRLRKALEQSEMTIATLADLAGRESPATKLAQERGAAKTISDLVGLEEEHEKVTTELVRDLPHLLIMKGTMSEVLESVKALREDLKGKLKEAKQNGALELLSASDAAVTNSEQLLTSLSTPLDKEAKERSLFSLHDNLVLLLTKQKEAQGAGFVPPDESSKVELASQWKQLLQTIDNLVGLLGEAFHKLTIDDPSTKAELEDILETQKQLTQDEPDFPAGFTFANDIIDACKRMLGDTNNLTDVIEKLRDVDDSLIKFQQIMQDNYYKLKPVVGTEEVPGRRRGGRATTFLHITYAEPTNPKEGINILQEMIGTLKKNTDNLFEIESKRVQVVENSLNIKRARDGLQLIQEIEKEEKALRSEDISILKSSPSVSQSESDSAAQLASEGLEPLEQIPNYAESITYFLKQVIPWLEKSLVFDRALNAIIKKSGAKEEAYPVEEIRGVKMPTRSQPKKARSGRPGQGQTQESEPVELPEALQPAVEKLDIDIEGVFYENQLIIEELVRLFPGHKIAQEADGLKKQHEEVWNKYPEAGDVRKTSATAELLVEWMPKERALISQLQPSGAAPESEEITGKGPSLSKPQRQKVKSGRPGASHADPFTNLKAAQDKLITDSLAIINDADAESEDNLPAKLQAALENYNPEDAIDSLTQREMLLTEALDFITQYYTMKIQELTEISTTTTEKTVLTVQDERVSQQLVTLQKEMKVKETLLRELQEELKELRALKDSKETKDDEMYRLNRDLKAAKAEIEEKTKKVSELMKEKDDLSSQKSALERTVGASTSSTSQVQHLEKITKELETHLSEQQAQYKALTEKYQSEMAAKEAEIVRLSQGTERSPGGEGGEYKVKYQHQLQKRFLLSLGTTMKFDKIAGVLTWKLRTLRKYQAGYTMPDIDWVFKSVIEDPALREDRNKGNEYMTVTAKREVETGPFYVQFQSTEGGREKPLGMITALGMMNDIRKLKTREDREQLSNGKRPPGFPEFAADYCLARAGSQADGAVLCNRLLLALQKMYKQRHSLATFYVRMLRVYSYAPIPYALSLSILQMAESFAPLATSRASYVQSQGRAPADDDQTGGEASLISAMDLVLNLFEGQPHVSRLVLQGLATETIDHSEYLKLKLAVGLKRTNSTVDKLYGASATTDKTGFTNLITGALPMIFTANEAEKLFSSLTTTSTLPKSGLKSVISALNLDNLANSDTLVTSLGVFLLSIADTYHYLLRDQVDSAQNRLNTYGWKTVTLDNLKELLGAMGIQASPATVQSWFDEARGSNTNLTPEQALGIVWRYPLNFGPPLVPEELKSAAVIVLLQELTTKRTVTTVTTVTKKVKVLKKK